MFPFDRFLLSAVTAVLVCLVPRIGLSQQAGDTCAGAGVITQDGTYAFTTTGASANDPCEPGVRTVWYRFVAPSAGTVDADLCGSSFDTFLTVFAGENCPLACTGIVDFNDDFCNLQSRVIFSVTGGTTYHFAISGFGVDDFGPGVFNFSFAPASGEPGDTCDSAVVITENGTYPFDTTNASLDDPCPFIQSARAVWFQFDVPTTGSIRATACPEGDASFDSTLSIHVTNGPCPTTCGTEVAFDALCGFSPGEHALEVFVESGDRVFMVVSGVEAADAGPGTLAFTFTPIQAGDTCASAGVLSNNGSYPFDSTAGSADHPCRTDVRTVWYKYTATVDGRINADLCGSSFDSHLTVFLGDDCPATCSNVVAENDDTCGNDAAVSFTVRAGDTYYLAISGFVAEDFGAGVLNFAFSPVTVGNTCAEAGEITQNGIYPWSNVGASTDDPCRANSPTAWYTFLAPSDGQLLVDTCGLATFDTYLSAFVGECPPSCLDRIAFNDDFPGCGLRSQITFPVSEGERYNIALSGFGSVQGSGEVLIVFTSDEMPVILGDLNGDGIINVEDVTELARRLADEEAVPTELGDINDDGFVNALDVQALAELIVGN